MYFYNRGIVVNSSKHKRANKTTPTQQKLLKIEVEQLKNLRDIELDFSVGHQITAIMGGNCSGKTTILHALACSFNQLDKNGLQYKFPRFFKPNTDSIWDGSKFSISHQYRLGSDLHEETMLFSKAQDRWSPRYEKRPVRHVNFLMISNSVPEVETFGLNTMVHYTKTSLNDPLDEEIKEAAQTVLNRKYTAYHKVLYKYGDKESIGVSSENISYPGLSMSSGEQRVFHILKSVFLAPKYALILVDEFDLFLHQDALTRLIGIVKKHCEKESKQLIFTTHFPPVASMYEDISVKMLQNLKTRTIVWNGYSSAALGEITGIEEYPLTVYVEDDVAETIVSRVAISLRIRRYLRICQYGAASNAFSLGVGLYLSENDLDNVIILLDGDEMAEKHIRREKVRKLLTGTEEFRKHDRKVVTSAIRALEANKQSTSRKKSPEQMLHEFLHALSPRGLDPESSDLLNLAHSVTSVPERHGLIDKIIELSGENRAVVLDKLVRLASSAPGWSRYTKLIRCWLVKKSNQLVLIND